MLKDLKLFINNNKINYEYKVDKDKLIINTITELEEDENIKIFYSEDIYEINLDRNTNFTKGKNGEIFIKINNKKLSFSVILKNNFFVKCIYEFINELIDKDNLINRINLFINSKAGKIYKKDLNNLLELIENNEKDLEELLINNEFEQQRISNLLLNNNTYLNIRKNMSDLDLMLLITSYIFLHIPPEISQEKFNELVNIAKNYDYALENVWRLGMHYAQRGYNYDLLDELFVNSKDIYYLGEYISGIIQVDKEKIVNKIIEIKDNEFIRKILNDELIIGMLSTENKEKLEKSLKENK